MISEESVEKSTNTTPNDTAFRQDIVEKEQTPEKPTPVTGIMEEKVDMFTNDSNDLADWETTNGSYGQEYLGIKEIAKEFPMKMQFQVLDKYIKAEMEEKGYDKTPAKWQEILKELETEFGTDKLNAVERLKKLSAVISILKKQKALSEKRKLYSSLNGT